MSHLLELSAVTSWPSNSYFRSLFCHTVFGLTILALTSSYQKWRHHDVASPKKISSTIIYGFFCKTSRFRINFALKRTLKFLSALDRTLNFCLYYFTVRLFWFCVVQKSNLLLDKRFSVCNSVIGQLLALSILSRYPGPIKTREFWLYPISDKNRNRANEVVLTEFLVSIHRRMPLRNIHSTGTLLR